MWTRLIFPSLKTLHTLHSRTICRCMPFFIELTGSLEAKTEACSAFFCGAGGVSGWYWVLGRWACCMVSCLFVHREPSVWTSAVPRPGPSRVLELNRREQLWFAADDACNMFNYQRLFSYLFASDKCVQPQGSARDVARHAVRWSAQRHFVQQTLRYAGFVDHVDTQCKTSCCQALSN